MLILDKRLALEHMVSLAERLHEAVPEPFSVHAASFMAMPSLLAVAVRRAPCWGEPEFEDAAAPGSLALADVA